MGNTSMGPSKGAKTKAYNKIKSQSANPTMPKYNPKYPKEHPYNNANNHQKLLMHVIERMQLARETRDQLAIRMRNIDLDINGFLKLNDDDRERMRNNRQGKGPTPVNVNLPLAIAKVDELLTFLLEVFWPNSGMHAAYSTKDDQAVASGFAMLLNQQAAKREHYRKFGRFLFDSLKYNISACGVSWTEERGFKLKNNKAKHLEIKKDELVWQGNDLDNCDMYNFFWDPAVHPVEAPTKGEFIAEVTLHSKFAIKKMAAAGLLYAIDRFIDYQNDFNTTYFFQRPIVRFDYNSYTGSFDWMRFATGGKYGTIGNGVELIKMCLWLNPKEFGLSDEDEYQIWRVTIANHLHIVDVEPLTNAHNMLPYCITVPFEDGLGLQQKSAAEQLVDFQRFASFLMNVHQQASRKQLFGMTIYDPTIVNLKDKDGDVAGQVPVQPPGYGKPIGDSVKHMNDAPDTANTMVDIERIIQLMEQILPTNMLKQVADLQRATTYQAAATVQGANRRNLKMAKVIDDQAVKKLRFMMMYNVMQYQNEVSLVAPDGETIKIDPAKLRDMDIEFAVGEGLQGIDKIMIVQLLHDVINTIVQSQQASQEIDIVALLNYWTTMIGDKTDLNQFRRKQLTPEQQNAQMQAEADAKSQAVQSAAAAHTALNPAAPGQPA